MKTFIGKICFFTGLLMPLLFSPSIGQVTIWSDNFDENNPANPDRVPEIEGKGSTNDDYFGRAEDVGGNTLIINGASIGFDDYDGEVGGRMWVGEDLDDLGVGTELFINWTSITTSGFSNLVFKGRFAAAETMEFDAADYLKVEYSFNGTVWVTGIDIQKLTSANDEDRWARNGTSPLLSRTFQELEFNIPGTPNVVFFRVLVSTSMPGEQWAIDDFRLQGTCNLTPPTITSNNNAMCPGTMKTLSGSPSGGTFMVVSGPGTVNGNILTANGPGTIVINYTITQNGCSATSSNQSIVVNSAPNAEITSSGGPICVGATRTLTGSPGGGTFTVQSGPGSLAGNVLTATGPGTINIRYTVTSGGCDGIANQSITSNSPPNAQITSSGAAMCAGATRTLTGTPGGGTFSVASGPGSIVGNTLTANGPGTIVVEYMVTVSGCSDTESQNITVNALPDPSITSSGAAICRGDTRTLTGTPAGGTFSIESGPGSISGGNTLNVPAGGGAATIVIQYSVTVSGCTGVEEQTIQVRPRPNPQITITEESAGEDDDFVICAGAPVELDAGDFASYFWSPGGQTTRTIEPLLDEEGEVTISVEVVDQFGCENTDEVDITVRENPQIIPLDPADISVQDGKTTQLELFSSVTPNLNDNLIDWEVLSLDNISPSPTSSFDDDGDAGDLPTSAKFVVDDPRAAGLAIYRIIANSNQCFDTLDYKVAVFPGDDDCGLFVPELLTPNGDGVNDEWQITPPAGKSLSDFEVILRDRTGCVVWNSQGNSGNFNPINCANGPYYYVILNAAKELVCKGAVTIITQN